MFDILENLLEPSDREKLRSFQEESLVKTLNSPTIKPV